MKGISIIPEEIDETWESRRVSRMMKIKWKIGERRRGETRWYFY